MVIYSLCTLTSLVCCVLLWRGWRNTRTRLLFWAAACFAMQTVNNVLLVLDKVVWPTEVDLRLARLAVALVAACLLLFGLIWDEE
jgi:hypothetical protein